MKDWQEKLFFGWILSPFIFLTVGMVIFFYMRFFDLVSEADLLQAGRDAKRAIGFCLLTFWALPLVGTMFWTMFTE